MTKEPAISNARKPYRATGLDGRCSPLPRSGFVQEDPVECVRTWYAPGKGGEMERERSGFGPHGLESPWYVVPELLMKYKCS